MLSYLEDELPEIHILDVDKATSNGIRAYDIVAIFCNIWTPGSVPDVREDEYDRTFYFTVEQILNLKNNKILASLIDWDGLIHLIQRSPAKHKRFYFWFAT